MRMLDKKKIYTKTKNVESCLHFREKTLSKIVFQNSIHKVTKYESQQYEFHVSSLKKKKIFFHTLNTQN